MSDKIRRPNSDGVDSDDKPKIKRIDRESILSLLYCCFYISKHG